MAEIVLTVSSGSSRFIECYREVNKMAKLHDGTEVDLNVAPQIIEHKGEIYVIGNGWLVSVADRDEAVQVLKRILEEPVCALDQKR
jgi:predicted methyltransferase